MKKNIKYQYGQIKIKIIYILIKKVIIKYILNIYLKCLIKLI